MTQPTAYTDQLHAQACDIADRLILAATVRASGGVAADAAFQLAAGPVSDEIATGAACCVKDQLGLAVMVVAELARRAAGKGAA